MSFHEKSRWIALAANLVVWGFYFVAVGRLLASGQVPDTPLLWAMTLPAVVMLGLIHTVAHIAIAIWSPREAGAPLDERDRAIGVRATGIAYSVLIVGLCAAITATLFVWTAFAAVNAVLLAFVVAESVRYGIEITAYRGLAAGRLG